MDDRDDISVELSFIGRPDFAVISEISLENEKQTLRRLRMVNIRRDRSNLLCASLRGESSWLL